MASAVPDAPTRAQLYKAANRLSIKIHGCSIDSLSRRQTEAIALLYRYAEEDRQRMLARQQLRMAS